MMPALRDLIRSRPRGTASELARTIGIDKSAVTKWQRADSLDVLSVNHLKKIADFFSVPIHTLIDVPLPLSDDEKAIVALVGRMSPDKRATYRQIGEAMAGPNRRVAKPRAVVNDRRRW